MTSLCARLRTKVGCSLGTGRPLLCLGSGARESSLSAGKGLRQAALLCAQHPRPRVRAARQPAHGRCVAVPAIARSGRDFPRAAQSRAPGRGPPAPRWDVGTGPACGGAPGAQRPRGPGRLSLARAVRPVDPSRGWRRNSCPPRLVFKGLGGFCRVTFSAD